MPVQSVDPKFIVTIVICVSICIIGLLYVNYSTAATDAFKADLTGESGESETYTETTTEQTTIVVYITGEVNKPDVYSLAEGARLVDLVEKAGGFTDKAYIDDLNLAQVLNDGEKFVVQNIDSASQTNAADIAALPDEEEKIVNINTADAQELDSLPGIGPKIAQEIIAYREQWGDFTSIDEIKEVKGIGDGIYQDIKDSITID